MNRKTRLIVLLVAMVITLGACGIMKNPYEIIVSKLVFNNGKYDHGELLKIDKNAKEKKIEDFSLTDARSIGNGRIVGVYNKKESASAPIVIYDIESGNIQEATAIDNNINEQRISVNEDNTAIYYVEEEGGLVRYDLLSNKKVVVNENKRMKYPVVTKDEKMLYYWLSGTVIQYNLKNKTHEEIIHDAVEYELSTDNSFIIFRRLKENGSKIIFYKYDIETGEEQELIELNRSAYRIIISEDGTKFMYSVDSYAYFSEWAKTSLYVYDLETNRAQKVFKTKAGEQLHTIIFVK